MNIRQARALRTLATSGLVALAMTFANGCADTLPQPIYANQVDEYFPEPAPEAPDVEATRAVRLEAEACAARLNGHRSSTEMISIIQSIISTVGGLASTAGGIFSAIDFGNPDIRVAMGSMASAGAAVVLVGNLVIGLAANPLEEQRLHTQGLRSWELAVELRYAGGDPEAVRQSLLRCQRDEAPPVRVVGAGLQFSF